MPLDGHTYLVKQGWSGKGNGLREGAISRPIAVSQKKTLAGVGKDRDEAFPFWDHVFTAASKAIQLKVTSSDEESDDEDSKPELRRTTSGIISNRRPTSGTPASGLSTPTTDSAASSSTPGLSLMAGAKREAAKRGLYSRFFRGPVLVSEVIDVDAGPGPIAVLHEADSSVNGACTRTPRRRKRERDDARKKDAAKDQKRQWLKQLEAMETSAKFASVEEEKKAEDVSQGQVSERRRAKERVKTKASRKADSQSLDRGTEDGEPPDRPLTDIQDRHTGTDGEDEPRKKKKRRKDSSGPSRQ